MIIVILLQASHANAAKAAYHQLNGHIYDWNAHHMMPLGLRGVIYKDDNSRAVWNTRVLYAWYIEPLLDQNRCIQWFVPKTNCFKMLGLFNLLPHHCLLPEFTTDQHASEVCDK